jgi:murein DD-endopeptidase MepM/ murein hydrolase activator NlpD
MIGAVSAGFPGGPMAISFALRACLLASASAVMTACATNLPLQAAAIDYRGDDPARPLTREAQRPIVLADKSRPSAAAASTAPPARIAPRPMPAAPSDLEPFQRVADLGASPGTSAVAEARSLAPETGNRPGGTRKLPDDNPSARAVEIQPSDTLYDISRRYSVNMRALIETNALEPPYALDVGGTIYLPPPNLHVVEAGETLYAVSRRYNVDTRSLALLNGIARPFTVWPGDELLLPPLARDQAREPARPALAPPPPASLVVAEAKPLQQQASAPAAVKPPTTRPPVANPPTRALPSQDGPISLVGTAATTAIVAPWPPPPPPSPQQAKSTPSTASGEFIWPVLGRVLKGYGPGSDGSRNDGINIAAAKGAELRASAGGEVVYAGNELAGFGNLILIRHPGGWVTAYAHCDTMAVSEGDLVRQAQVIGTAGSTGNAGAPQVHFELRKGKEPVDPTRHLPPLQG